MSKMMIIGAGKTGRGFVARLLAEKNIPVTFVDKDETLVRDLQNAANNEGFTVRFFGEVREPMKLAQYQAVTWDGADFSDAELIFVSVGGTNLADVGARLKEKLPKDRSVYIITCENASDPAGLLRRSIDRENVKVSQATVFCTTTAEKGELDIASENYPYLQFDADLLEGYVPEADTVRPVNNFGNFLTRKLFTYNAASAVIAYLGYIYGYTDYTQAANSPVIQALLDQNYAVTNKVLCEEFGYDPEDQREFARLSRDKFTSRTIVDTVERNAREPQRKLGPTERIIGPLKLVYSHGENCQVLAMTAAAALLYDGDGEDVWREIRRTHTPEEILKDIGGVEEQPLIDLVMEQYRKFEKAQISLKEKILTTELLPSQVALFYLGQVGFILKYQGKYLMIDGYLSDYVDRNCSSDLVQWERLYPAPIQAEELDFLDYVFCTHTHYDHADPYTLKAVAACNKKAVFAGCASVCRALREYGIPAYRICKVQADEDTVLEENIRVTGVPAAHEELHPDPEGGYEETGFLLTLGDKRIFHSGDCCPYDGLEQRIQNCDVLILPINGRDYYRRYIKDIIGCFDSVEAVTIADHTHAGLLVPVHWDLYEVNAVNPGGFADTIHRLAPSQPYHMFVPGERYIIA